MTERHREKRKPFVKRFKKDISRKWAKELKGNGRVKGKKGIVDLLVKALASEVAREVRDGDRKTARVLKDTLVVSNKGPAAKGLAKADRKLAKLAKQGHPDDSNANPNLKYRKPKYKNVESILKFVESKDDKGGGVKLVIMNFND